MVRRYKQARLQSNIKLIDAAELFGVSQPTVSAWESGRQDPSIETIKKMAKHYRVSIEYLLGYDSLENLSSKEHIPQESIGLFHAKPVWVKDKGWALVNITDNTLVYVDREPEKIERNTELYFAPPAFTVSNTTTEQPLTRDELYRQTKVWVEPISSDTKLRELLRGTYEVKGEYVENTRGSRFHFDAYNSNWVAFKNH